MKQREPPGQPPPGQPRKIIGFHLDEQLDWVAELECGHQQHIRHNPPWTERHWVTCSSKWNPIMFRGWPGGG